MNSSSNPYTSPAARFPKTTYLALGLTFLTALFVILLASPTQAAITWDGDIDPADPNAWTSTTKGLIGKNSTGSITVAGASALLINYGSLGDTFGSNGTATVTGSGSAWTNRSFFYVGNSGIGSLNIQAGGQVSNAVGYVGYNSGSTGTVTVTGEGSKWACKNCGGYYTDYYSLSVGYSGTGTLNIEAGGQVSSDIGYLGEKAGSSGTATVTGPGSMWVNSSSLYVGSEGTGTLNITAGGQVSDGLGYIGSLGTVTISGTGSKWTNTGDLYNRVGTLTVNNGGTVVVGKSIYASNLFGNGTISANGGVVDANLVFDAAHGLQGSSNFGSGGTLTITQSASNPLGVGYKGNGTLQITEGVTVSASYGYLGYNSGSSGTAKVTGSGSKWNMSQNLYVGNSGNGILNIESGGQIGNSSGYLGYAAGTEGTVTVSGANSKWQNGSSLFVGKQGSGILKIEAGGQVISGSQIFLGSDTGSQGDVSVTGSNSKLTASSIVNIGYSGSGSLAITNGGEFKGNLFSTDCIIGYNPSSQGIVTIADSGSIWTADKIVVGRQGSGSLYIENGGIVNSVSGGSSQPYNCIGSQSNGVVRVSGPGSQWNIRNNGLLLVGDNGTGNLEISNGGQVSISNGGLALGGNVNSLGTATIKGIGSKCTMDYNLCVGASGNGTLKIEDGAATTSLMGFVGYSAGSTGIATVSGGSSWTSSSMYVGYSSNGTLNIGENNATSGGMVITNLMSIGAQIDGIGTCNLNNGAALQIGTLNKGNGGATFQWNDGTIKNYKATTDLTVSSGLVLQLAVTGTHAFNIDAGRKGTVEAVLSDATSGGTLTKQGDGLLVLSAANTYSGTTTIEDGQLKLVAGGDIAFSSEIINQAGFLIEDGNHSVQKITGSGTTQVFSGSLTASSIVQDTLTIGGPANAVPEPASLILLAISALVMFGWSRKRRT